MVDFEQVYQELREHANKHQILVAGYFEFPDKYVFTHCDPFGECLFRQAFHSVSKETGEIKNLHIPKEQIDRYFDRVPFTELAEDPQQDPFKDAEWLKDAMRKLGLPLQKQLICDKLDSGKEADTEKNTEGEENGKDVCRAYRIHPAD